MQAFPCTVLFSKTRLRSMWLRRTPSSDARAKSEVVCTSLALFKGQKCRKSDNNNARFLPASAAVPSQQLKIKHARVGRDNWWATCLSCASRRWPTLARRRGSDQLFCAALRRAGRKLNSPAGGDIVLNIRERSTSGHSKTVLQSRSNRTSLRVHALHISDAHGTRVCNLPLCSRECRQTHSLDSKMFHVIYTSVQPSAFVDHPDVCSMGWKEHLIPLWWELNCNCSEVEQISVLFATALLPFGQSNSKIM